jgi:hypothetical protein
VVSDFGIVADDDRVGWQGEYKVGRVRRCHDSNVRR